MHTQSQKHKETPDGAKREFFYLNDYQLLWYTASQFSLPRLMLSALVGATITKTVPVLEKKVALEISQDLYWLHGMEL